jgi:hypothetical protein
VLERGGLPLPHCIGYSFITFDYPFTFPIVELNVLNLIFSRFIAGTYRSLPLLGRSDDLAPAGRPCPWFIWRDRLPVVIIIIIIIIILKMSSLPVS